MKLKYITCSDPREDVSVNDMMRLMRYAPQVEIGIQAHPSAMSNGMPRNAWFKHLMTLVSNIDMPMNVAVHVNYQWCDMLCGGGMPDELDNWFKMTRYGTQTPAIRRWQLNIGDGTKNWDANAVAKLIAEHPQNEFILPYNAGVAQKIEQLNKTGAQFSLLYDSSYGYGITPEKWDAPVYDTHPMGYAGGLSPENVATQLAKIAQQVPTDYTTWIDAEGRLMRPNTRQFDVTRAISYVENALCWTENKTR